MRWRRSHTDDRSSEAHTGEFVERLVKRRRFSAVEQATAALNDRGTVENWFSGMVSLPGDHTIVVHRHWGTLAATTSDETIDVLLEQDGKTWYATVPGSMPDANLTAEQVKQILLEAMTASTRPKWPVWNEI